MIQVHTLEYEIVDVNKKDANLNFHTLSTDT